MELLQLFATDAQKQRWLYPEGDIGSAFVMTEPYEASSDPSNLTTRISRDGDQYVVNGRKWFASNASHANCELLVVVGVTDPEASRSKRQSLVLVPRNTPGVEMVRDLPVFDHRSPTNTHPEFTLDVRVPVANLLESRARVLPSAKVSDRHAYITVCARSASVRC